MSEQRKLYEYTDKELDREINPLTEEHISDLKEAIALGHSADRILTRLELADHDVKQLREELRGSMAKAQGLLAAFDMNPDINYRQ